MSTPPQIQQYHLLNNNDTISKALTILRPHLPTCLPLYRRLQFSRFFSDTMLLTSLNTLDQNPEDKYTWIMAFVDRTCRPETEVWIFGSWETNNHSQDEDILIRSLVKAMKSLGPLPTSIHQSLLDEQDSKTNQKDVSGVSRSDYAAHLLDPNIILCGAIHSTTTKILERNGLIKNVFDSGLVPNHTYVFDTSDLPVPKALPGELRWGELEYEHFALVRSRTQIPRQDKTLADLPNLAIYNGQTPVAWVFVGIDASLTTLHVEEQYRGQGLAKTIALKLWKEKMDKFWEDGVTRWAHDYVIKGNSASVATSVSLGGRHIGDTFWVRLDMSRVD